MKARKHSKAGVTPGRIGTKWSDRRFRAPDGGEWDSRFEWTVYDALTRQGHKLERCKKGGRHSVSYSQRVRSATCGACGSADVGKQRTYTPDLFHDAFCKHDAAQEAGRGYWIELKGYLRADERSLLRALCKARPDFDLRFIFQRNYRVSAKSGLTILDWTTKFLKRPCAVWTGAMPAWEIASD